MAATNMTQRLSFVSSMQIPSLSMKQQLGSSITHRNEHTQCRHNTKSQPHGDRHGLFNNPFSIDETTGSGLSSEVVFTMHCD